MLSGFGGLGKVKVRRVKKHRIVKILLRFEEAERLIEILKSSNLDKEKRNFALELIEKIRKVKA